MNKIRKTNRTAFLFLTAKLLEHFKTRNYVMLSQMKVFMYESTIDMLVNIVR